MGDSWIGHHKYAVLLALLCASLVLQSFAVDVGTRGLFSDIVHTALGVAIFLVVFERRLERTILAVVLVAMVAIGWSRHVGIGDIVYRFFAFHVLLAVFLWWAVFVILRELFRRRRVGVENVLGAICGYLIAGDAWAGVNELAYQLVPAAFDINPEVAPLLADWHGRLALFSYYSIAQMLTIGYADMTPVRAPATTLSLFATLFGVFYTAVVVSQFVGLAQASRKPD